MKHWLTLVDTELQQLNESDAEDLMLYRNLVSLPRPLGNYLYNLICCQHILMRQVVAGTFYRVQRLTADTALELMVQVSPFDQIESMGIIPWQSLARHWSTGALPIEHQITTRLEWPSNDPALQLVLTPDNKVTITEGTIPFESMMHHWRLLGFIDEIPRWLPRYLRAHGSYWQGTEGRLALAWTGGAINTQLQRIRRAVGRARC